MQLNGTRGSQGNVCRKTITPPPVAINLPDLGAGAGEHAYTHSLAFFFFKPGGLRGGTEVGANIYPKAKTGLRPMPDVS